MSDGEINVKQKLFDRWAPNYDILLTTIFYQAIHKRLLEYVELPENARVLDVGCGTGRLLERLADTYPTLWGTGFDLSPEMIRQARQSKRDRHRPRLIFLEGNAEEMPFAQWQFDAAFNTISFLHYPHPDRVLSEVQRVLRPGGKFYLVDFTRFGLIAGRSVSQSFGGSGNKIHFYPAPAREELGREAGLNRAQHYHLLGPVLLTIFTKD